VPTVKYFVNMLVWAKVYHFLFQNNQLLEKIKSHYATAKTNKIVDSQINIFITQLAFKGGNNFLTPSYNL
jgi:hypothetical protein